MTISRYFKENFFYYLIRRAKVKAGKEII